MAVELDVSQLLLLPPGTGELIGDSPDRRIEILSDRDELHATWSRFGPRRDGADLHIHRRHTDLFYVLQGELTMKLGADGSETVAPAGTLVAAPPLVVHGFRNGSDAEVRYLNFHAPGAGFADYLRGLSSFDSEDPPADGGRPVEDAVIAKGGLLVDRDEIRIEEVQRDSYSAANGGDEDRPIESFYVLAGELTFSIGGDELRAETGAWVQLPAGSAYALAGSGRYLAIRTPGRPA